MRSFSTPRISMRTRRFGPLWTSWRATVDQRACCQVNLALQPEAGTLTGPAPLKETVMVRSGLTRLAAGLALLWALAPLPAQAQTEFDLALVVAVDISFSMDTEEQAL